MREKKSPCEWSTSTEFSYFRRKMSCSFPSEHLVNFFGHLRILSDPYEKSWHSQDENVAPIKIDGRYRIYPITRQRNSGDLISGDYFSHISLQSAVCQQPALPPPAPINTNSPSPQIIERFHSSGQQLCQFIVTEAIFYIWKEFNSHRTSLDHTTWSPFHCFGTPIRPTWRHVKTLYSMVSA